MAARRRWSWLLVPIITVATFGVAGPSRATPVGVGIPVAFDLTDNQGSWFDTRTALFGTRSLGVAVTPRTRLLSLPLDSLPLLNGNLGNLLNLPVVDGEAPC